MRSVNSGVRRIVVRMLCLCTFLAFVSVILPKNTTAAIAQTNPDIQEVTCYTASSTLFLPLITFTNAGNPPQGTNLPPHISSCLLLTTADLAIKVDLAPITQDPESEAVHFDTMQADNGQISLDGTFLTYTPNGTFIGTDSITFQAIDAQGATASGNIRVSVEAADQIVDEHSQDFSGQTLQIALGEFGYISLPVDETRASGQATLRQVRSPSLQQTGMDLTNAHKVLEDVLEIESTIALPSDIGVSIKLPAAFAAQMQAGEQVQIHAFDNTELPSTLLLSTAYDAVSGVAHATIPSGLWIPPDDEPVQQTTAATSASQRCTRQCVRLLVTVDGKKVSTFVEGKFTSIPGQGEEYTVRGSEELLIGTEVKVNPHTLKYPVQGTISRGFAGTHKGIDFGVPVGTPVYAAHDGAVSYRYNLPRPGYDCAKRARGAQAYGTDPQGNPLSGYGRYATVSDPEYGTTVYGHLAIEPDLPRNVLRGDLIGYIGLTGCLTGPHLHFEYKPKGAAVDPKPYLADMPPSIDDHLMLRLTVDGQPVPGTEVGLRYNQISYALKLDLAALNLPIGRHTLQMVVVDEFGNVSSLDDTVLVIQAASLRATLTWDTNDTDVDLHVYDSAGHHAWYSNLRGIPGGSLDRDITTGFGPEQFTLDSLTVGISYTVKLHYYSDHGNGPTTATIRVEVDGVHQQFEHYTLTNNQWVTVGTYPQQ